MTDGDGSFTNRAAGVDIGTPAFDPAKSDLRANPIDKSSASLLVCYICNVAYEESDEWHYCPKCSADLVEVECE